MSNDSTQATTPESQSSTSSEKTDSPSSEAEANIELLQYLSNEFDTFCQERHAVGAKEYGDTAFLKPDVDLFSMIQEELADVANYARYQYIKMRRLQILAAHAAPLPDKEPQVGANAFFPAGGVQN